MNEAELQAAIKMYYEDSFRRELADSKRKEGNYSLDVDPPVWLQKLGVHSGATFYAQFLRYLEIVPGKRLLDVACGLGGLLMVAEGQGADGFGLDISSKGVKTVRVNAPLSDVLQANAECLPYRDETFDYVTCLGSLGHMLHPEIALSEMQRVCVSGGSLCVVVPNTHFLEAYRNLFRSGSYQQLPRQLYEKVNTLRGWRKLIEETGWRIAAVKKDNHTWLQPRFSARQKVKILLRSVLPACLSYSLVFVCEKRK